MNAVLSAIAPVFLLIFLGYGVRRSGLLADSFWESAERLTYFLLFPALIVATLADADLTGLQVLPMAVALIGAILIVAALVMLLKPVLGLDGPGLTSAFQGAVRMNTYIALTRLSPTGHGVRGAVPPTGQEGRAARCRRIGQAA